MGGKGRGRDNRLPRATLGTVPDRVGVRGGVIGDAQCHDLAVVVVEQFDRFGVVD